MARIAVWRGLSPMICVEVEGTGSGDPLAVFAELGNAAAAQGLRVLVGDPVALAKGRGRFTIDVPNAQSTRDAVAVVRSFLDQLPGDQAAFTVITGATRSSARVTTSAPPLTLEPPVQRIRLNDRVAVPDGCLGSVIGFYARAPKTVLVLIDAGDSREYPPADLRRLG